MSKLSQCDCANESNEYASSAEDFKRSMMAKPCWARYTPARLFSGAADDALKTIKVILSGDASV